MKTNRYPESVKRSVPVLLIDQQKRNKSKLSRRCRLAAGLPVGGLLSGLAGSADDWPVRYLLRLLAGPPGKLAAGKRKKK